MRLARLEAGTGGRPLLCVHGFGGAKEDFAMWLDPLAGAGWHVVAPDLRGHGDTGGPDDEAQHSLDLLADDLLDLLDELGWGRVAVLGHSMGGMVVQHAIRRDARRWSALVLMDTWTGAFEGVDPELVELAVTIVRTEGMEALAVAQDELDGGPLATPAYQAMIQRDPGYEAFCRRKLLASTPAMYAALAQELVVAGDHLDVLVSLGVPTLVIVGEQDKPFLDHAQRFAAEIPAARLAVIADGGHSPQFEAPEPTLAELQAFLSSLDA